MTISVNYIMCSFMLLLALGAAQPTFSFATADPTNSPTASERGHSQIRIHKRQSLQALEIAPRSPMPLSLLTAQPKSRQKPGESSKKFASKKVISFKKDKS